MQVHPRSEWLCAPSLLLANARSSWNLSWWREMWRSGKGKLITLSLSWISSFRFLVLSAPTWKSFLLVCSLQLAQSKGDEIPSRGTRVASTVSQTGLNHMAAVKSYSRSLQKNTRCLLFRTTLVHSSPLRSHLCNRICDHGMSSGVKFD